MDFNQFLGNFWDDSPAIAQLIMAVIFGLIVYSFLLYLSRSLRFSTEFSSLSQLHTNLLSWKKSQTIEKQTEAEIETNDKKSKQPEVTDTENDNESEEAAKPAGLEIPEKPTEETVAYISNAPLDDLIKGIDKDTLVHERLSILRELEKSKVRVNIGMLRELSELQESKSLGSRFPAYAMSLSMLLGMLGTFLGLAMMVGEISQQLNVFANIETGSVGLEAFKARFQEIQHVMEGVRTAFNTTLVGLVGTILISFFDFDISRKKARFFDEFEQLTVKQLLPNTFPDLERDEVINAIKNQLEETFDQLNHTIDKNQRTLSNIDGLYLKFDSIIDTVKEVLSTNGTEEVYKVIEETQNVNRNLEKVIEKYQNKRLLEDFQKLASTHDHYLTKHSYTLEQSKWLPNARVFMIVISSFLGLIALLLFFNLLS